MAWALWHIHMIIYGHCRTHTFGVDVWVRTSDNLFSSPFLHPQHESYEIYEVHEGGSSKFRLWDSRCLCFFAFHVFYDFTIGIVLMIASNVIFSDLRGDSRVPGSEALEEADETQSC